MPKRFLMCSEKLSTPFSFWLSTQMSCSCPLLQTVTTRGDLDDFTCGVRAARQLGSSWLQNRQCVSSFDPADCSCHRARHLACAFLGHLHGATSACSSSLPSRQIQHVSFSSGSLSLDCLSDWSFLAKNSATRSMLSSKCCCAALASAALAASVPTPPKSTVLLRSSMVLHSLRGHSVAETAAVGLDARVSCSSKRYNGQLALCDFKDGR
mmetsp:Transcript_20085/g.35802  ORF Transcript_20085/g.35802 Transcript_20085/m.35802 type:complete len:210 (-) Transcript_20085:180-809(-)